MDANNKNPNEKSHRHTPHQTRRLEAFFKECPHPDEKQRQQLSREIGLEVKQIKFWFQNKRTQIKFQNERVDNNALRAENERVIGENLALKEALNNVVCPACGGRPPLGEEERQLNLQKLRVENMQIKEQYERLANYVTSLTGKPVALILDSIGHSSHSPAGNFFAQGSGSSFLDPDSVVRNIQNPTSPYGSNGIVEIDKSALVETATRALDELLELLRVNEPVWAKTLAEGKYVLHHERYNMMFPQSSHLKGPGHMESSKDSSVVPVNALDLVQMFTDMNKWTDLFPTIVTKARILETLDTTSLGGVLQLIYEEMHILSPLVAPREFLFLRYCQQVDQTTWIILDASCDCFREIQDTSHIRSWKRPSGCLIQSLPNGTSMVTWIEHVEVNSRSQNHPLYRDLIAGAQAYGASRWIATLERMCERSMYSVIASTTMRELEGVINIPERRRNMMKLSTRMVKNLCAILSMPADRRDFPHFPEFTNSGVRISMRKNNEPCHPHGMVIAAATSQWLPVPFGTLFSFLRDTNKRHQWDMIANGCPINEIAHIPTGTHPENYMSLLQPLMPNQSSMLLLQENNIDPSGAYVIFAPIDFPAVMATLSGGDMMKVPILPSGFLISSDGRSYGNGVNGASTSTSTVNRQGGSLLTFAFQIQIESDSAPRQLVMESVSNLNNLITSTLDLIKMALGCSDLH